MNRKRRSFSSSQKAKIALAALQEPQTASEIAREHEVHPNQVGKWNKQSLEILQMGFTSKRKIERSQQDQQELIEHLYQRIGQLQVELDWLKKSLSSCSLLSLRSLIAPSSELLSVSRQCELLGFSRSSY